MSIVDDTTKEPSDSGTPEWTAWEEQKLQSSGAQVVLQDQVRYLVK